MPLPENAIESSSQKSDDDLEVSLDEVLTGRIIAAKNKQPTIKAIREDSDESLSDGLDSY
jgi:hypothetical protein